MAIDIPSLFRDVIETPEQRQRRKLAEQAALIPQAREALVIWLLLSTSYFAQPTARLRRSRKKRRRYARS